MDYDQVYQGVPAYFGQRPDPLLERFGQRLDPDRRVLDVGCGQGRHTLYLARQGIGVDAIDPSQVAVDAVAVAAAEEKLDVSARCLGFADQPGTQGGFGGILLFGLLQLLTWEEISGLSDGMRRWRGHDSLVLLTAFTTGDPAHPRHRDVGESLGPNSYRLPDGEVLTYLEPGQALDLFPDTGVVHHHEGLGPEHRHGDAPPERHALVELVLRCL